jgi:hypothetical protein
MMLRSRFARTALVLVTIACASAQPASHGGRLLEGVYVVGPEANSFRECSGTLRWTVEFVPGAAPAAWPPGTAGGYNATYYFVRWQADLIDPPRVPLGEPPAAPLRARVYAVKSMRALRPGECGERG